MSFTEKVKLEINSLCNSVSLRVENIIGDSLVFYFNTMNEIVTIARLFLSVQPK